MAQTIRNKVFNALEISYSKRKGLSFVVNITLSILIFFNFILIVLYTVTTFYVTYHNLFV